MPHTFKFSTFQALLDKAFTYINFLKFLKLPSLRCEMPRAVAAFLRVVGGETYNSWAFFFLNSYSIQIFDSDFLGYILLPATCPLHWYLCFTFVPSMNH